MHRIAGVLRCVRDSGVSTHICITDAALALTAK